MFSPVNLDRKTILVQHKFSHIPSAYVSYRLVQDQLVFLQINCKDKVDHYFLYIYISILKTVVWPHIFMANFLVFTFTFSWDNPYEL